VLFKSLLFGKKTSIVVSHLGVGKLLMLKILSDGIELVLLILDLQVVVSNLGAEVQVSVGLIFVFFSDFVSFTHLFITLSSKNLVVSNDSGVLLL